MQKKILFRIFIDLTYGLPFNLKAATGSFKAAACPDSSSLEAALSCPLILAGYLSGIIRPSPGQGLDIRGKSAGVWRRVGGRPLISRQRGKGRYRL